MMLENLDFYKPNIDEVVARYQAFYSAREPGHLCTFVDVPYQGEPLESVQLTAVDWDDQSAYEDYLDMTLRNLERIWRANRMIDDDNIPTASVFLGIAEYSAFVGGEVIFQSDTSMATPAIEDWDDFDRLELKDDNPWTQMLERGLEHLLSRCNPVGIPVVRGLYAPLDLAQALRGEALFTDFFECPDQVHRLMRFCVDATIWLEERLQALIGPWRGGRAAGGWFPAKTICMSEDIACMISPKTYAEFAKPYTQQVIHHFGSAQIHTHSLGLHVIPEMSTLENLLGIQISQDPNTPRAFDHFEHLLETCADIPFSISCTMEDLKTHLPSLSQRTNFIPCPSVKDFDEADQIIRFIREHSRI
jgi:hypothetical protein